MQFLVEIKNYLNNPLVTTLYENKIRTDFKTKI